MDALVNLVLMLIVAGVCGAVAQAVFGFQRTNFLVSVAIGVAGAYIGTFIASRFGLPSLLNFSLGSSTIDIVWAVLGSALLLFVYNFVESARRRPVRRRR